MTDDDQPVVLSSRLVIPPFEMWVAVAAIYAGISQFVPSMASGNARVVADAFPRLAPIWSVLYAIGGALILAGLLRRSPRIEGAGVHLLGSGITVAGLAALAAGAQVLPVLIVQGGAVVACIVRLFALRRLS